MKPDAYLTGTNDGPNYVYLSHQKEQARGLTKANAQPVHELYKMRPFMCRNCGSRMSDEELADKVFGERVISCCPERSLVTMDDIAANWLGLLNPDKMADLCEVVQERFDDGRPETGVSLVKDALFEKRPKPNDYKAKSRGM